MREDRTIREGPAQRSGPRLADERPSTGGKARSRISTAAVVMLLAFVAALGALVISNLIAIVRGLA